MSPQKNEARRLLLLGDARQVHLSRWAQYFIDNDVDVVTFSLEATHHFPGVFHHVRVPESLPGALRYPLAVPRLRSIVSRFRPHIVNAHFAQNYGMIASLLNTHPWVLSTWGSDIMLDPDKSAFHHWRTRHVVRRADKITSDAIVMTERLRVFGVPTEDVVTLPFGVDTDAFSPSRETDNRGPKILSNRKLDRLYNVSTVIDAFGGVHEAFPGATLTIAGDGPLRSELMAQARRSVGGAAVTFVGDVDHDRMPFLLREHDVFVSTALSDTTSVSLLEAMACGLFPIVSDIPANREWITHSDNGSLVPVRQPMKLAVAIIDAWRDATMRERARRENPRIVRERARWQDNMGVVRDLFDDLVGRQRSS